MEFFGATAMRLRAVSHGCESRAWQRDNIIVYRGGTVWRTFLRVLAKHERKYRARQRRGDESGGLQIAGLRQCGSLATKRLATRGCETAQISSDATGAVGLGPADGSCAIYHTNGGGVKGACADGGYLDPLVTVGPIPWGNPPIGLLCRPVYMPAANAFIMNLTHRSTDAINSSSQLTVQIALEYASTMAPSYPANMIFVSPSVQQPVAALAILATQTENGGQQSLAVIRLEQVVFWNLSPERAPSRCGKFHVLAGPHPEVQGYKAMRQAEPSRSSSGFAG